MNYPSHSGYPDEDHERRTAYELLGILVRYAPVGPDQVMLSEMYAEMQRDGLSWREISRNLAGSLSDGLHYGNWPWLPVEESPIDHSNKGPFDDSPLGSANGPEN